MKECYPHWGFLNLPRTKSCCRSRRQKKETRRILERATDKNIYLAFVVSLIRKASTAELPSLHCGARITITTTQCVLGLLIVYIPGRGSVTNDIVRKSHKHLYSRHNSNIKALRRHSMCSNRKQNGNKKIMVDKRSAWCAWVGPSCCLAPCHPWVHPSLARWL